MAEKIPKDQDTAESEVNGWELFGSAEARLRDLQHLEMAYEWLRNRQKTAQLKRAIESL